MDEWSPEVVVGVASLLLVLGVATIVLTRGILSAAKHPSQGMLVASLSLLSASALIGGLVFDSDTSLALAGTGFGALAGAVSAVFTSRRRNEDDDE